MVDDRDQRVDHVDPGQRVDHVLATIDGALQSYGDAMRWSPDPDPPEERLGWLQSNVEIVTSPLRTPGTLSFYSGAIGDYSGVPIRFEVTVDLEEINRSWATIAAEARAAFDRISQSMLLGQSLNRLGERLQPPPVRDPHWQ